VSMRRKSKIENDNCKMAALGRKFKEKGNAEHRGATEGTEKLE